MRILIRSLDFVGREQGWDIVSECSAETVKYLADYEAPVNTPTGQRMKTVSVCSGFCTIRELCRAILLAKDPVEYASAVLRGFNPDAEMAIRLGFSLNPGYSQKVVFHVYE